MLDVVALRNERMRGQAFIVFKDLQTSTAALRKEDGRMFAGKSMKISYAKGKSFATIEHESGKEALYQFRMGVLKNTNANKRLTVSGAEKALTTASSKRDRPNGANGDAEEEVDDDEQEGSAPKRQKVDGTAGGDEEDMMVESEDDDDDAGPTPA